MQRLAPFLALGLCACTSGQDSDWFLFNSAEDVIEVPITADTALGDATTIDLRSTTGAVVIGSATLDPGSGPVGTTHSVIVQVGQAWQEDVGRVAISADSGDRGVELFEFRQDSADHSVWVLSLTSSGTEGEVRTDRLAVQLFQEQLVAEPIDTASVQ